MGDISDDQTIIVGVDFGTTYSCVAFVHSATPRDVKILQEWPVKNDENVPSVLRYFVDTPRDYQWGFETSKVLRNRNVSEALSWFKLLLQYKDGMIPGPPRIGKSAPTAARPLPGRASQNQHTDTSPAKHSAGIINVLGLTPELVVTDYLKGLQGCIRNVLVQTYGRECVDTSKVKYVLTIPAIWSDSAKGLMVKAAQDAGFGIHRTDFTLIGEPEAAAAYTLNVVPPNRLNVGDTFLICDAGGGTVDLISYRIDELRPLKISEIVPGSGDVCGSIFLNHGFEEYLKKKLTEEFLDNYNHKSTMMENWEKEVKFVFKGRTFYSEDFDIGAPGLENRDADDDGFEIMGERIYLPPSTVELIFMPIIKRIIDLVSGQVNSAKSKGYDIKAILLVGGFGCSDYLFKRLEAEQFFGQKIEVMRPVNPRTAIARGALVKGRDGSYVAERRSRRFYGLSIRTPYVQDKTYPAGWERYKVYDALEGNYKLDKQMEWYIKKDQVVGENHWVSSQFYCTIEEDEDWRAASRLLVSDEENEPAWNEESVVKPVCVMGIDFNALDKNAQDRCSNQNGKRYFRVFCKINMRVRDEVLEFSCTSVDGTKQLGQVKADFSCSR